MIGKIVFAALILGFLYLFFFNKPRHHSSEELEAWFNMQLQRVTQNLEQDIEKDKQGQYPHAGKQTFEPRGSITYHLLDKQYSRFDLSEHDAISRDAIMAGRAWSELLAKAEQLGLSVSLDEVQIDGDEVDSYESLDEYIDDIQRYYTVTVTGW